jgi:hypothetical protein
MAAVARSGPADARSPCPLCGGLIHPIAGRCKHCKGDLRTLRSTRPAAAATLPALNPPSPAAHANGHGRAPVNGHQPPPSQPSPPSPPQSLVQSVAAAVPIPLAIQHGPADAAILPPRPTGRLAASAPRASWKSWPVIVIILAVIAIVTAVVLMLFPPGGVTDEGTHDHSLQPAPDRMDTNPSPAPSTPRQPPSTSPDPWSRRGGDSTTPPPTTPPTTPTPPPTPLDDPDIDDPGVDDALAGRNPFSRRGGLAGGLTGGSLGTPSTYMLYSIVKHACSRLSTCGTATAQTKALCDSFTQYPSVTPPSCAAAARCLRSLDEMSCDVSIDDPMDVLQLKTKFTDCADALSC